MNIRDPEDRTACLRNTGMFPVFVRQFPAATMRWRSFRCDFRRFAAPARTYALNSCQGAVHTGEGWPRPARTPHRHLALPAL